MHGFVGGTNIVAALRFISQLDSAEEDRDEEGEAEAPEGETEEHTVGKQASKKIILLISDGKVIVIN